MPAAAFQGLAGDRQHLGSPVVPQQSVVTDLGEALGQNMVAQAPDELDATQVHLLDPVPVPVVLVGEAHALFVDPADAGVGDGHAVRVPAEVLQDRFRPGHRSLGEDHPGSVPKLPHPAGPAGRFPQGSQRAVEGQVGKPLLESPEEPGAELPSEELHREEVLALFGANPAVGSVRVPVQSAAGDQDVEMLMGSQGLAPGVEQGRETDLGLEPLASQVQQRGGGGVEEQSVQRGGVLQDQRPQGLREGEDDVEAAHGQQGLALAFEPFLTSSVLAVRTMAVPAAQGTPLGGVAGLATPERPAGRPGVAAGQAFEHAPGVGLHGTPLRQEASQGRADVRFPGRVWGAHPGPVCRRPRGLRMTPRRSSRTWR